MTVQDIQQATQEGVVIVDFMAEWCSACKIMYPVVESSSQKHEVKLIKLDADEHAEVFDHYEVYGIPHIKIFVNGQEKSTFVWPKSPSEIDQAIAEGKEVIQAQEMAFAEFF